MVKTLVAQRTVIIFDVHSTVNHLHLLIFFLFNQIHKKACISVMLVALVFKLDRRRNVGCYGTNWYEQIGLIRFRKSPETCQYLNEKTKTNVL